MRTPRRLVAMLAASALSWGGLALVAAPVAQADTGNRDAPHDPATYYAGTEGLTGNALALALNAIIDGNVFVPYTDNSSPSAPDVWKALKVLDRDPNDASKIIDAYNGDSLDAANQCGSSCALNGWNREHTWAQSRGSFNTNPGPGTDLFHMRPLRGNTNSSRGNKDFDNGGTASVPGCPNCKADSDSFEPGPAIKGDLARGLFYMDVRYNGDADDAYGVDLRMWDQVGNSGSQIGKLATLVAWSLADPPNDAERTRNNLIDSDYQHNRNPFIDHPEWVCSIWGSQVPAALCPANAAPVATPQSTSTAEDTTTVITLAGTDADGNALTYAKASNPAHGTVSITSGGSATYTPAANYSGPDSFTFTVNDGIATSAPAAVSITVTAVNDAPTAGAQTVSTPQNTAKVIALTGDDVDSDPLTFTKASDPAHGTVSITSGGEATYTPVGGYSGQDSFTFTVDDGALTSDPATVSINVTTVNHAPTATPQSTSTPEDTATVVTLAGTDQDGDTLTYALGAQPTHGTLSLTGNQATYTPTGNFHGDDSFTFTVNDGALTSTPATVSVTVAPVNDAPTATDQGVTTAEDTDKVITLAGSDVDGDTLTFAKASDPAHGTVTITPGGQATYSPTANYNGPDSFTFTVSDGTLTSAAATASVTVTPVNDTPTATAQSVTTAEDTATVITLTGADVDIDDGLTFALGDQPSHGTVSLSGDQATYTPAGDYHGPDSFTFTVSDGTLTSSAATVSITVTAVNDAPTATAKSVTTAEDTAKVITLAGNDVDGDPLTFAKASDPAHGTVTITAAGEATYTPADNYNGPDAFTFTVNDGTLNSAPVTVSIDVTPVNDTPTVTLTTPAATRGKPVTTTVKVAGPSGSPSPSGQVLVKNGATTLGTVTLGAGGTATLTWTPTRAGTASLVATYAGGVGYDAASSAVTPVAVAKSASLLKLAGKFKKGKPGKVKIAITSVGGLAATGKVTIKVGGKKYTATLKNGVAKFRVPATAKAKVKVKATYAGDGQYSAAKAKKIYVTK